MAPSAAVRVPTEPVLPDDRRRQLERLRRELSRRQADWRREERQKRCPTGLAEVDELLSGGFAKGLVTSLVAPLGAGAGSLVARAVGRMTSRGEACAWVDPGGSLSAPTLARLGVELSRLLWARPPAGEVARTAQLLARSGAFGLVVVDVPDEGIPTGAAQRLVDAARAGGSALVLVSRNRPALAAVKLRLETAVCRPRLALVGETAPPEPPKRQVRLWIERSAQGGEGSTLVRLDPPPLPVEAFRADPLALRWLSERHPRPPTGELPVVPLARRLHTRPVARHRQLALPEGGAR